jgi:uncharacterized protein YehS (DUF1456 family)
MAEENIDDTNITNGEASTEPEILAPELEPSTEPESEEEDVEEVLRKENEELKKKNQELYEISKKAKGLVRDKDGNWVKKAQQESKEVKENKTEDISMSELRSLIANNVPEEDTQVAIKYARMENISVSDALKTPELKAILGVKAEYRKTAQLTSTGSARRGTSKVSDDVLDTNASKGNLPQDDEGIRRLAQMRTMKK